MNITELKAQVLQRADIVAVISKYIKLSRKNSRYLGLCPFHAERTPSFDVSPKKGIFKCFGCGVSGDVIEFVKLYEKTDFVSALKQIASFENMPVQLIDYKPEARNTSHSFIKAVDGSLFRQTLRNYDENVFVMFLLQRFGLELTQKALETYFIGTAKGSGTIFWQVDQFNRPRTASKIFYGTNGKRIKEKPPMRLFTSENGYSACFFGEHLLVQLRPGELVGIVEAEKTAIIASLVLPTVGGKKVYWLAACGNNGITAQKAEALRGLNVMLCPDFSWLSRAVWGAVPMRRDESGRFNEAGEIDPNYESRARILQKLGCKVSFLDICPGRTDNSDLADFVLYTEFQEPEALSLEESIELF